MARIIGIPPALSRPSFPLFQNPDRGLAYPFAATNLNLITLRLAVFDACALYSRTLPNGVWRPPSWFCNSVIPTGAKRSEGLLFPSALYFQTARFNFDLPTDGGTSFLQTHASGRWCYDAGRDPDFE